MTHSAGEPKLPNSAEAASRSPGVPGVKCAALGAMRRKISTQATATPMTTSMPASQPSCSPTGAAISRPESPPMVVPEM